jgi:mRNA interferase HigB
MFVFCEHTFGAQMTVFNYDEVEKFVRKHANARPAFDRWYRRALAADWRDFDDVKKDFQSADRYKACTIFDIGGNNYRLIVKIAYQDQVIKIRKAFTHAEYDKEKWKNDCDQN